MRKNLAKRIEINVIILSLFLVLSGLNGLLLWHFHRIPMKSLDMTFHWQRAGELLKNNSFLPNFATNLFSGNGSAVMTMYPYIFLYPYVILFRLTGSVVTSSLLMFVINTFLALVISYFSCLSINGNHLISFLFANLYTIVPMLTAFGVIWFYTGELYAFIFIPIVIFGFLRYLKTGRWMMLSIGITLLIYSSVVMTMITAGLLLMWLLVNYAHLNKRKFINLCKAIGLTLLTGAFFLLPAVKLFLLNHLNDPNTKQFMTTNFGSLIIAPFSNHYLTSSLTIYAVLGIILGLIMFKKLSPLMKQSFLVSLVMIFISSNYFPWQFLTRTPITMIQYTGRILLVPQVIMTYVLAMLIDKYIHYSSIKDNHVYAKLGIMILLIFSYQISNQDGMFNQFNHKKPLASNLILRDPEYQTKLHHNSAYDYYPKSALKDKKFLLSDQGFVQRKSGHNEVVAFKSLGNGRFVFHNYKWIKRLNVPFLKYNGINYQCLLDNQFINTSNNHQIIQISNVPKGHHQVDIKSMPDKTILLSRTLTLFSFPIYGYLLFRTWQKRHD